MLEVIVDKKGSIINLKDKQIRTPLRRYIENNNDINQIEIELKRLGTGYKIIDNVNRIVNLNGSVLPFGCFKDPKDKRDYNAKKLLQSTKSKSTIPDKITYRGEMPTVKNQGNLGSCVGFAVTAMKEWQEQEEYLQEIEEGSNYTRPIDHYNLSEQWVYYKAKEIDSWPNSEGTSIRYALKQVQKLGVPPEKAWLYNDENKGQPEYWSHLIAKWAKGGNYWRVKYGDLAKVLLNYGPFPIGIICFREIFNVDSSGFVPYPSNPSEYFGGHAICLVSYHKNRNMFGFKNSWGTSWGSRGYGYLPAEYLRDFMLDAWIMKDIDVSKNMLRG